MVLEQPKPILEAHGVGMTYGSVTVLSGASMSLVPGRIHALVGQNGAGKSTMLGALAGRIIPTAGTITAGGTALGSGDPRAARAAGVVAVYQELTILPAMSARDNVLLGDPPRRFGVIDRGRARREFTELAERLGVELAGGEPAGELSVAQQQMLEIMRAARSRAKVLLLDEPTASLAATERAALLSLMRRLAADGIALVFVSHNLDEVLDASDDITVFRSGRLVTSRPTSAWTKPDLVEAMLGTGGRALAAALLDGHGAEGRAATFARKDVLTVDDLRVPGVLPGVSLRVRSGEIVGIGGLVGSGRTTLLRALAGDLPRASGRLSIGGAHRSWPRTPRAALRAGLALVPEERKRDGLVLGQDAVANITLSNLRAVARAGWIRRRYARTLAVAHGRAFGLPEEMVDRPVGALSGGNQQKVVLARWMHRRPRVLLADEPGRGIDIGAKAQILSTLRDFVSGGGGVLMVSSEHEELLTFADRVLVMAAGRIVADLDNRARTVTEHDILTAAFDIPHQEAS